MAEPCPPLDRLRAVLDGQLSAGEQTVLTRHLDGCSTCQEALERLASGSNSWQDVARQLRQAPRIEAPPSLLRQAWRLAQPESAASALSAATPSQAEAGDFPFLEPPANPTDLGQLGPYPILKLLGRGGMGLVFQGIDPTLGRLVAIKVMAPNLAASDTSRQRFLREARAAAAVKHPHVVAIHAVAESAGIPYLVMQFIPGRSLQDRLNRDGPLPPLEAARLGLQMAQGLAAAHGQGLVHRDIKPANILIEERSNQVKITDFGLARAAADVSLTQSGVIAGTPAFMSPEQARGDSIDARSDLFSLGSVLYALCTGQAPFRARQTIEVLRLVCEETPTPVRQVNPEVPLWLAGVIERLHARDPAQRFASAQEVADLLEDQLARVEDTEVSILAPRPKRRRVLPAVGVLLLLLAVGAAVFFARPWNVLPSLPSEEGRPRDEKGTEIAKPAEPSSEKDQEEVLGSGQTVLLGTWSWKIDGNVQGTMPQVDFHWQQDSATERHLSPYPGAGWALLEGQVFDKVGVEDLTRANYSNDKLPGVRLTPDTVLALRTRDGKFAKARVVGYRASHDFAFPEAKQLTPAWKQTFLKQANRKDYHLEIQWTLYQRKGFNVEAERRLKGHSGWGIRGVTFTPDGKRALSSDAAGNVILWDLVNGRELRRLVGHRGEVCAVAVAGDGKRAVSGGVDGTIRVWDLEAGKEVRNLAGRSRVIEGVALSANGQQMLSSSAEGILRLWDVDTGQELKRLEGHKQPVRSVVLSRDDRLALSGSRDNTVRLWDVATGKELKQFQGHTAWVAGVALSADGRLAASASYDKTVRVWDLQSGKEVSRFQGHGAAVEAVAFTPDGRHVLSGGLDGTIWVWDAATARELHRLEGPTGAVYALAVSADGRAALSGGADLILRLWRLPEPRDEGNKR